ncbi:MAG: hypothetical protein KGZ96_13195 [Clostridia bacterium]|nr:hypothetical protein [Clostridia bacterium]
MIFEKIEASLAKKPPEIFTRLPVSPKALQPGDRVVIIGGGISGSSMARYLLQLCQLEQKEVEVILVNSTNCNYCGGLVTNLALETFSSHYNINIQPEQVLSYINETVYINPQGSFGVPIAAPLISTLRTSKFGLVGFDDSIKDKITEGLEEQTKLLTIIEPTLVREITPLGQHDDGETGRVNWEVTLSRKVNGENIKIACHTLVLANGLRGINNPLIKNFSELTGYKPPEIMAASVTEIDTSQAVYNNLQGKVFILDGIIPDCVVALVCKGKHWVTVTCLNKKLTLTDIQTVFKHPQVMEYIDLPNPTVHLRCGIICGATVFTKGAKNFYGDNWVAIGDLTGYGRILKDGYFAALVSAKYAAETLIYHGTTKGDFDRHYYLPLKKQTASWNKLGIILFHLNLRLLATDWFPKLMIAAGKSEKQQHKMGGAVHSAIRALTTGELSYLTIALLFIWGLAETIIKYPFRKLFNI